MAPRRSTRTANAKQREQPIVDAVAVAAAADAAEIGQDPGVAHPHLDDDDDDDPKAVLRAFKALFTDGAPCQACHAAAADRDKNVSLAVSLPNLPPPPPSRFLPGCCWWWWRNSLAAVVGGSSSPGVGAPTSRNMTPRTKLGTLRPAFHGCRMLN